METPRAPLPSLEGIVRERMGPVSWLEAPMPAFPGPDPSGWRGKGDCLLQWRGRAGFAPDFRVALSALSQLFRQSIEPRPPWQASLLEPTLQMPPQRTPTTRGMKFRGSEERNEIKRPSKNTSVR